MANAIVEESEERQQHDSTNQNKADLSLSDDLQDTKHRIIQDDR